MIAAAARILALSALGHATAVQLDLPVPGAALGFVVLLGAFMAAGGPDRDTGALFDRAIPHAPVLFVPAGAGVLASPEIVRGEATTLLAVVVLGTITATAVTGLAASAAIAVVERRARSPMERTP